MRHGHLVSPTFERELQTAGQRTKYGRERRRELRGQQIAIMPVTRMRLFMRPHDAPLRLVGHVGQAARQHDVPAAARKGERERLIMFGDLDAAGTIVTQLPITAQNRSDPHDTRDRDHHRRHPDPERDRAIDPDSLRTPIQTATEYRRWVTKPNATIHTVGTAAIATTANVMAMLAPQRPAGADDATW